jgi:hypothetical protein
MYKKILLLIILITPLALAFSQQFFNPFQYGIKTVEKVEVVNNLNFRNAVREKAAELLNEDYLVDRFRAEGDYIKDLDTNAPVSNDVIQNSSYKTWENLIRTASDIILSDCDTVDVIFRTRNYCHWKTVKVDIQGDVLKAIYIAPSGYSGPFPRVAVCEKGIGQCLLFFFDRALRILYFAALALGVIFLMWAGILYITKPLEAKNIHQRFVWGIIGIIVGITSFTIVIALENWLAGGLATEVSTTGGGGGVSEVSGPVQEGSVSVRRIYIDRQKDSLYITFDVKPKSDTGICVINIVGKDDTGKVYNIADNLQLTEGLNIEKVFRGLGIPAAATEIELTFSPGDPPCTINPTSYIARIGQYASISPAPRIIIDQSTAKIDENKKFSVFVSAEKQCNLSASFYNLTKGENLGSSLPMSISAPQYFNFNLGVFGDKFDIGDTVRVVFSSKDCEVSVKQLDIRTSKLVTTVPTIKKPIINIDSSKIKIYGQQTINVNIEDLGNLRNILEQALGITVIQRNLYDPPFTMYITYNATTSDNQPPLSQGSCTIYGTLRGVKINQFSFDRTKAVSYTTFNKDFSFTINYEANRKGPYNIPIYLPLPNNLLGFIYLKLYYYRGDCEEVKVDGQNIAESPFSTTYDIETGRFYSVSGNLLRDLFGF